MADKFVERSKFIFIFASFDESLKKFHFNNAPKMAAMCFFCVFL